MLVLVAGMLDPAAEAPANWAAAAAAAAAEAEAARRRLLPLLLAAGDSPSGSGRSSAGWWAKKQIGRLQLGPNSHRQVMNLHQHTAA